MPSELAPLIKRNVGRIGTEDVSQKVGAFTLGELLGESEFIVDHTRYLDRLARELRGREPGPHGGLHRNISQYGRSAGGHCGDYSSCFIHDYLYRNQAGQS